jgi:beta-glucuronidase
MTLRYTLSFLLFLGIIPCFAQIFQDADPSKIALFPQQNEFRNTLSLSGMWQFKKDTANVGELENWQNGLKNSQSIAVPGSWNEQFTDSRDYLGLAWYEKETYIPQGWKGQKILIRVGSANYAAKIWLNGVPIGKHEGGHLPFAFDISSQVKWGASNRITISIENVLKPSRVPTGGAVAGGLFSSFPKANFDFFPYAGLNRDVLLYTIPAATSIKDATIKTTFSGKTGSIDVKVEQEGKATKGKIVISGNGKTYEGPLQYKRHFWLRNGLNSRRAAVVARRPVFVPLGHHAYRWQKYA